MLYATLFILFASLIIGVARWLRCERRTEESALRGQRVRCRLGRERVEAVVIGVAGKRHLRVRFPGWSGREQVRARSALTFV